jgi:hypothetical protein
MQEKQPVIDSSFERRRAERRLRSDLSRVHIIAEGDLIITARVVDVSESGLRLRVQKDLGTHFQRDAKVVVEMDRLIIRASVRWCSAQKENPDAVDIGLHIEEDEEPFASST